MPSNTSNDSLTGRVAVVTGASSGIGRALALQLAAHGAVVIANARREAPLAAVVNAAPDGPGRLVSVAGDCTQATTIDALIARAKAEATRPPDLCIVNAGRGLPGTVLTSDDAQWSDLFHVNVIGSLRQLRAFSKAMRDDPPPEGWQSRPRDLVVIGSTIGREISAFNPVYGATKFALHSATEALRRELSPDGIRVTLVEPGFVRSNFQRTAGYDPKWFDEYVEQIGPILTPDDVASIVLFAVSQPARVSICDVLVRPTRQTL